LITVVEVLVRLDHPMEDGISSYSASKAGDSDLLPVVLAQARSLCLLLRGEINYNDFIGQSVRDNYDGVQHRAYYGMVTGQDPIANIAMMRQKLFAINELYNKRTLEDKDAPNCPDLRDDYLANHKDGGLIEGRTAMYLNLQSVYGSGDESGPEDAGYSSDEDEDSAVAPVKPHKQ
jgi:hypothetical protein